MKNLIKNININSLFLKFIRQSKLIFISICIGFIITIIVTTYTYSHETQQDIANQVIRFHVLANSNSNTDQDLKINIKNSVINMLESELNSSSSINQTRELLASNINNIQELASSIVKQQNFDYSIGVKLDYDYFPTKVYGDVTLPAGVYECLKIEIGEAVGDNWWCVMFPPLCFVDITMAEVSQKDKDLLKNSLTSEQYNLICPETDLSSTNGNNIDIQVKFKIIEIWQEILNK